MATTPTAPLPERSYPRRTRSTQRAANGLLNPQRRGSTHRTELLAGLTTFVTIAYIIAVNAGILSHPDPAHATGLNFEALVIGTILAAAIPTLVMGLLGALLMEEDEQWSTSHRYLDMRVYWHWRATGSKLPADAPKRTGIAEPEAILVGSIGSRSEREPTR